MKRFAELTALELADEMLQRGKQAGEFSHTIVTMMLRNIAMDMGDVDAATKFKAILERTKLTVEQIANEVTL